MVEKVREVTDFKPLIGVVLGTGLGSFIDKIDVKASIYYKDIPNSECILFPSKDNRDWAAFERELDGKPDEKKPLFHSESESFNGSVEMVSIPDRPMMAAVIMSGLLAGGFMYSAGVLANKAVNYADMILEYTKEESNDKGTN